MFSVSGIKDMLPCLLHHQCQMAKVLNRILNSSLALIFFSGGEPIRPGGPLLPRAIAKAPEGEGCPRCGGYVYAAEQMLARGRVSARKYTILFRKKRPKKDLPTFNPKCARLDACQK